MQLGIENKVAVVLGAGGGLGAAIAHALAKEGVRVAVCDLRASAAAATVSDITATGATAVAWDFDQSDTQACARAHADICEKFGEPDILINNTGGPPLGPVADVTMESWRLHFDSMVVPVVYLTQLMLPAMRRRRWGRVVTSTSSGVISPIPGLGLSNSLRSAIVGWNKTLAREVGADGVTANIVLPGRIATDRIRQLDETRAARQGVAVDAVRAESLAGIPLGRYGDPHEYGDVVAFLASERASYLTGSIVRVDGGLIPSI